MAEGTRVSCCILGCKRTFRAEVLGDDSEYMCGKHYRADPVLQRIHKDLRLRSRRMVTILNRYHKTSRWSDEQCEAVYQRMVRRCNKAWSDIVTKAQEMQDQGFWAPRPRSRKLAPKSKQAVSPLNSAFEAEFQRKKRAMQAAKSSNGR